MKLASATSRIHIMFARHGEGHLNKFERHLKRNIPQQGGQKIFVCEAGSIPISELSLFLGPKAEKNALACIGREEMNQQLETQLEVYINYVYTTFRSNIESVLQRNLHRKNLRQLMELDTAMGKLMIAAQMGYEIDRERMTPQDIFYDWMGKMYQKLFFVNWQEARANFAWMFENVQTHYNFIYQHCLGRDIRFLEQLLRLLPSDGMVVSHRGIAHQGFFERYLEGINSYTLDQPIFSEILISESVKPNDLTDHQIAQIFKEFIYEFILQHSSLKHQQAYNLASKLPDAIDELEGFFERFNQEFGQAAKPRKVIKNIINYLRSLKKNN